MNLGIEQIPIILILAGIACIFLSIVSIAGKVITIVPENQKKMLFFIGLSFLVFGIVSVPLNLFNEEQTNLGDASPGFIEADGGNELTSEVYEADKDDQSQQVDMVTRESESPEIIITCPADNETVSSNEVIEGTVRYIPESQKIWIIVYPYKAKKYYPFGEVDIKFEGNWNTDGVPIGTNENVGDKFNIIAILANETAQKEFNEYLQKCRDTGVWLGMDDLPEGAEVGHSITVTRK